MRKPGFHAKRFIEIDLLRGLAILLMIFGHILWDLDYFGIFPMNNGIYTTLQKIVPTLFFLLVGVGLIAGRKKKKLTVEEEKKYNEKLMLRGLKIFNLGMIITIITIIVLPERPVMFGVLHCIGLSIVLSAVFLKYRYYNILFASVFITLGMILSGIHINNPSVFHLAIGLHQPEVWRFTVDYFPILPWFGVILLGIGIGDRLYLGDERRFKMPDLSRYKPAKLLSWMGQHSLELYLLHQPIIAGTLYVFVKFFKPLF